MLGRVLSGDSGRIYWESEKRQPGAKVSSQEIGLDNRYCEYSLCFDMIIDDALARTGADPRPILRRGAADGSTNNFAISLDKQLNDLHIEVSTMQGATDTTELFVLDNLPTDKGFTIGFVLSESFMEVYLNGQLYSTKTFKGGSKLKSNAGDFYDMMTQDSSFGRTKRLRLWNSVVDAPSMRTYAGTVSPPFTPKTSYVSGGGSCQ